MALRECVCEETARNYDPTASEQKDIQAQLNERAKSLKANASHQLKPFRLIPKDESLGPRGTRFLEKTTSDQMVKLRN